MASSITASAKSRGRPRTTGTGQTIGVRLQPEMLAKLDAWIAKRPTPVSRPAAIRAFIVAAIGIMEEVD